MTKSKLRFISMLFSFFLLSNLLEATVLWVPADKEITVSFQEKLQELNIDERGGALLLEGSIHCLETKKTKEGLTLYVPETTCRVSYQNKITKERGEGVLYADRGRPLYYGNQYLKFSKVRGWKVDPRETRNRSLTLSFHYAVVEGKALLFTEFHLFD